MENIKCPDCGNINSTDASFCKFCNAILKEGAEIQFNKQSIPEQKPIQQTEDNFKCPSCSAFIKPTLRFCNKCGCDLSQKEIIVEKKSQIIGNIPFAFYHKGNFWGPIWNGGWDIVITNEKIHFIFISEMPIGSKIADVIGLIMSWANWEIIINPINSKIIQAIFKRAARRDKNYDLDARLRNSPKSFLISNSDIQKIEIDTKTLIFRTNNAIHSFVFKRKMTKFIPQIYAYFKDAGIDFFKDYKVPEKHQYLDIYGN